MAVKKRMDILGVMICKGGNKYAVICVNCIKKDDWKNIQDFSLITTNDEDLDNEVYSCDRCDRRLEELI